MDNDCLFCNRNNTQNHVLIGENKLFYATRDNNPVTVGHTLIIPKKHIEFFFDLTTEEFIRWFNLLQKVKTVIQKKYNPDGFNIGINEGEAAGRTIHYLHIHIIPRYIGDVENPKGGIRNIIPGKGGY